MATYRKNSKLIETVTAKKKKEEQKKEYDRAVENYVRNGAAGDSAGPAPVKNWGVNIHSGDRANYREDSKLIKTVKAKLEENRKKNDYDSYVEKLVAEPETPNWVHDRSAKGQAKFNTSYMDQFRKAEETLRKNAREGTLQSGTQKPAGAAVTVKGGQVKPGGGSLLERLQKDVGTKDLSTGTGIPQVKTPEPKTGTQGVGTPKTSAGGGGANPSVKDPYAGYDFKTRSAIEQMNKPGSKFNDFMNVATGRGVKLAPDRNPDGTYQEWTAEDQRKYEEYRQKAMNYGLLNADGNRLNWTDEKLKIDIQRNQEEKRKTEEARGTINTSADEGLQRNLQRIYGEIPDEGRDEQYDWDTLKEIQRGKPAGYADDDFRYDAALYDAITGQPGSYNEKTRNGSDEEAEEAFEEVEHFWDIISQSRNAEEAFAAIRGYTPRQMVDTLTGKATRGQQASIDQSAEELERRETIRGLEARSAAYQDDQYHEDLNRTTLTYNIEEGNAHLGGGDRVDQAYYRANHPFAELNSGIDENGRTVYKPGDQLIEHSGTSVSDPTYFMTDEQRRTFNKFYNAGDKESASAYLEGLMPSLLRARSEWRSYFDTRRAADRNTGWLTTVESVATAPAAGFMATAGAVGAILGIDEFKDPNSLIYDPTRTNMDTGATRTKIWGEGLQDAWAWAFGEKNNEFAKGAGEFFYNVLTSGLNMGTAVLLGGGASGMVQLIMSSEAAGQSMVQNLRDGKDPTEAGLIAVASGVVEAVTEKYSIEALLSSPKNLRGYLLKNTFTEGTEEVASDILNTVADVAASAIWGHKNELQEQYDTTLAQLNAQGIRGTNAENEALKHVLLGYVGTLGTSFLAGAMSGGLISGTVATTNSIINRNAVGSEEYRIRRNNRTQEVLDVAAGIKNASPEYLEMVHNLNDVMKKKGSLSSRQMSTLLREMYKTGNKVAQEASANTMAEVAREEIAARADREGVRISEADISRAATAAVDFLQEGKSRSLKDVISRVPMVMDVIEDLSKPDTESGAKLGARLDAAAKPVTDAYAAVERAANAKATAAEIAVRDAGNKVATAEQLEEAGITQKNISAEKANIRTEAAGEPAQPQQAQEKAGEPVQPKQNEEAREKRATVLYDYADDEGNDHTGSGEIQRVDVESGQYIIRTENGEQGIKFEDAKAADEVTAAVMNYVEAANMDSQEASDLLQVAQQAEVTKDNVKEVLWGAREMMTRGFLGMNFPAKIGYDPETAKALYQKGQAQAKAAETARKAGTRTDVLKPGEGKVEYRGFQAEDLDGNIRKQVEAAGLLAKRIGYNLIIENDEKNRNRFGEYDRTTNSVILNIAGSHQNGTQHHLMVAMSHEVTHLLENNSPEAYRELREFVFQEMTRNGMDITRRIAQKMDNYNHQIAEMRRKGQKVDNIGIDGAVAEIVADACDQVLGDQRLINQLAEEHPSLFQKIKEAVQSFIQKVMDAARGMRESGSIDSLYIQDMNTLAQKWGIALQEVQGKPDQNATKAYQEGENVTENGQKTEQRQFSVAENENGFKYVVLDTDQALFDNVKIEDLPKIMEGYITKRFKGTIIGIEQNKRAYVDRRAAKEYARPAKKNIEPDAYKAKGRAASELDNLMQASEFDGHDVDKAGRHEENTGGWNYYDVLIYDPAKKQYFEGKITTELVEKGERFHDLTAMKNVTASMQGRNALRSRQPRSNSRILPSTLNDNIKSGQNQKSLAEMDQQYMQAAEHGDEAQARKLMEQAAKKAGYTMKVYHGTPTGGFTQFKGWSYFTENRAYADRYQNPSASSVRGRYEETRRQTYELLMNPGRVFDTRKNREARIYNQARMEYGLGALTETDSGLPDWTNGQDLIDFIEENDLPYDTIILDEGADGGYGQETRKRGLSYLTRPAQVKSAEPITYDDQGNVIPLSERFNDQEQDIRYSLAEGENDTYAELVAKAARGEIPESRGWEQATAEERKDIRFSLADLRTRNYLGAWAEAHIRDNKLLRDGILRKYGIKRGEYTESGILAEGYGSIYGISKADQRKLEAVEKNIEKWEKRRVEAMGLDEDDLGAQYITAWNKGDLAKMEKLLMDKLTATDGVIPYKAPHWYNTKLHRYVAQQIKTGDPWALDVAAVEMANLVPKNAVLIPIPPHTGIVTEDTDTMLLARKIAELTGRPVVNALQGNERESRRNSKEKEGKNKQITAEEMGLRKVAEIPEGMMPYFIDNVVGSGVTAKAAHDAFGYGITLAYAKSTRGAIPGLKDANGTYYDPQGRYIIPLEDRFDLEQTGVGGVKYSLAEVEEIQAKQQELLDTRKRIKEIENSEEMQAAIDKGMKGDYDDYNELLARTKLADLKRKVQRLDDEIQKWQKEYQANQNQQRTAKERQAIEKSGLAESEYRNKQAVKQFGITTNPMEAGYIIRNGSMLNFSGEKGKHYGYRASDHREIGIIYEDSDTQGSDAMITFMNDGNIRVMPESMGIDLSGKAEPTAEQYRAIRRLVNEWGREGEFAIDYSDENGDNIDSVAYEGRISAERVIADIKQFYKTGEVRQPSELSRFYSLEEDTPGAMDWIMGLDPKDLTGESVEFFNTKNVREMIRNYQKLHGEIGETQAKIRGMKEALQTAKGDEARKLRINIQTENNKLERLMGRRDAITDKQDFSRLMQRAQSTIDTFLRGKTQEEVQKNVDKMKREAKRMRETAAEAAKSLEKLAEREDNVIAHRMMDPDTLQSAAEKIKEANNNRGDIGMIQDGIAAVAMKLFAGDGENAMMETNRLINSLFEANWAQIRFGMNAGQHFNASDIRGEARDYMAMEIMEQAASLLDGMANAGEARTEIESLVKYVHSITQNTRQTARGMSKIEELAKGLQERGDELAKATEQMRGELQRAIRYFDMVNEKNRAEASARQIEEITRTLESSAAQRILEEQNKWAHRLENDRNMRRLTLENQKARRQIHTAYSRVAKLLLAETDDKNIPEYLKPAARAAVRMIMTNDASGGKKITNVAWQDLLRNKKTMDLIDKRDGTDLNLDGILEADGGTDLQDAIREALDKIQKGIQFYNGGRGRDAVNLEGDKAALDLVRSGMAQMYDIVTRSRQIFIDDKAVDTANVAYEVDAEARKKDVFREWVGKMGKAVSAMNRSVRLGNLTPEYFFKNLGNNGLSQIYNQFKRAEDRYGRILRETKEKIDQVSEKTGYETWDMDAKHEIQLESGQKVKLTLEQMMSLVATWKREKTLGPEMSQHLEKGGFVFEEKTEKKVIGREARAQRPHRVTAEDMAAIQKEMTKEQLEYVNGMVEILSKDMSKIGNEASMRMYGIEKYKETYYFPFAVWDGVKNKASNTGSQVNPTNNNRAAHQGFTNRRKNNASNAVMLRDFSQVCAEHINQMATYATFGGAIEGMNRVMNYRVLEDATNPAAVTERNVESVLTERYGRDAVGYIRTFMQDLNGGATQSSRGLAQTLMSIFKKNAVGGSLSVALQQPLSYIRASTMINTKYLAAAGLRSDGHMLSKKYWQDSYGEMLAHSGVAVIKDMGKFDMNFSQGATDWLKPDAREKGIRKAYSAVEEATNRLPELMDQYTWVKMWEAIKMEQHDLNPQMDMKSDEFLDKVGERFNDVMRKTQVYDSVLVKSELMRRQDWVSKSITAFRAEPTLSLNLFIDALHNVKAKGGKKQLAAVMSTFLLSAIAQAAVKGIMGAGRNPDEKKTLAENFAYRFGSSFISETNPLSLIPGYDNIVELISGGDINDDSWGMIKTFFDSVGKIWNPPTGENLTLDSGYRYIEDTVGQITQILSGIPAKNLMRDSRAVYNWFMAPYAVREGGNSILGMTYSPNVLKYQMIDQFTSNDLIGAINAKTNNAIWNKSANAYYGRMYQAEKAGDTQTRDDMAEYVMLTRGTDQKKVNSGIASAVKADESLTVAQREDYLLDHGYSNSTSEITKKYNAGEISEAELRQLYREHFPDKDPNATIWGQYSSQFKQGEISESEARQAYIKYHPGKKAEDADAWIFGVKNYSDKYKNGEITEAEYKRAYLHYHPGKTEKDVNDKLWNEKVDDYKDGKVNDAEIKKLYKKYHPDADEKDTFWAMDKLAYQKKTGKSEGYSIYLRFDKAVEDRNLKGVREATRELTKYGQSKDPKGTMKKSVTSYVRPLYMAAGTGSKDEVSILNIANATLEEAGYTSEERKKYLDGWKKDKKKGKK